MENKDIKLWINDQLKNRKHKLENKRAESVINRVMESNATSIYYGYSNPSNYKIKAFDQCKNDFFAWYLKIDDVLNQDGFDVRIKNLALTGCNRMNFSCGGFVEIKKDGFYIRLLLWYTKDYNYYYIF